MLMLRITLAALLSRAASVRFQTPDRHASLMHLGGLFLSFTGLLVQTGYADYPVAGLALFMCCHRFVLERP